MERTPEFLFGHTDPEISQRLAQATPQEGAGEPLYTRRFTQGEDFFLLLSQPFSVGALAYHHDFQKTKPSEAYLKVLKEVLDQLIPQVPEVFQKLTWFFDPRDVLHPSFFQSFLWQEQRWLFTVKLDLTFRPRYHQPLGEGSNDFSPPYQTRHLFLESYFFQLETVEPPERPRAAFVKKYFDSTWTGESGRGYFVQGYWIDNEISKFMSKAFISKGQRIYPYYLLKCHLDTICAPVVDFSNKGRKAAISFLKEAISKLSPLALTIQEALKDQPFDETLEWFMELRDSLSPPWASRLGSLNTKPYLNALEQKEYQLHGYLE